MSSETSAARSTTAYTEDVVDQQIPIRDDKRVDLELTNADGPITVRATDASDIRIHGVKHGKSGSSQFTEAALVVDVVGNHLKITPRFPKLGISRVFGGGVSFDITVELPAHVINSAGARVRANSASGAVKIEDISGEVNINTASGEMTLSRIDGDISIRSSSGSARLTDLRGELRARSASGDVMINGGQIRRMKTTSASGNMEIVAAWTGADSSRIETVSGNVTLDILEAPDMKLTFSSVSGQAIVAHPLAQVEKRTWLLGDHQRRGPVITVRTVSGDLRAGARQAAHPFADRPAPGPGTGSDTAPIPSWPVTPPSPPTPPTPPTRPSSPMMDTTETIPDARSTAQDWVEPGQPDSLASTPPSEDEDRLTVLQAVERGELDIEDALNRLDTMDEPLEP